MLSPPWSETIELINGCHYLEDYVIKTLQQLSKARVFSGWITFFTFCRLTNEWYLCMLQLQCLVIQDQPVENSILRGLLLVHVYLSWSTLALLWHWLLLPAQAIGSCKYLQVDAGSWCCKWLVTQWRGTKPTVGLKSGETARTVALLHYGDGCIFLSSLHLYFCQTKLHLLMRTDWLLLVIFRFCFDICRTIRLPKSRLYQWMRSDSDYFNNIELQVHLAVS